MSKEQSSKVEQEPVAYMTEDGRVSMAETVNTAMPRASKESFYIPLYDKPFNTDEYRVKYNECYEVLNDLIKEHEVNQKENKALLMANTDLSNWLNVLKTDYYEVTKERDEYQQAAEAQAMSHKVERDTLMQAWRMAELGEPVAWVKASELIDLLSCNGMSIWAESPSVWFDEVPEHLIPVFRQSPGTNAIKSDYNELMQAAKLAFDALQRLYKDLPYRNQINGGIQAKDALTALKKVLED